VTSAFDGGCQMALLAFGEAGLFASFNLSVYIYETLQGLNVLVIEIRNVGPVFKNLRHVFKILS